MSGQLSPSSREPTSPAATTNADCGCTNHPSTTAQGTDKSQYRELTGCGVRAPGRKARLHAGAEATDGLGSCNAPFAAPADPVDAAKYSGPGASGPGLLSLPDGWGFGLGGVYLAWVCVLAVLYPVCHWFADVKRRRRDWWLAYL